MHGALTAVRAVPVERLRVAVERVSGGRDTGPHAGPAICRHRPPGARPAAGCVARQRLSRVTRAQLDVAWLTDTAQRDRALDSLLVDGLVEQTADGRFALAGEGD